MGDCIKEMKMLPSTDFTGVGHIFEKERDLARVIYYLNVEKPSKDLIRFKGSMTVCNTTIMFNPATIYALQLQDGRKLDFYAQGIALADYNIQIQPIGEIY